MMIMNALSQKQWVVGTVIVSGFMFFALRGLPRQPSIPTDPFFDYQNCMSRKRHIQLKLENADVNVLVGYAVGYGKPVLRLLANAFFSNTGTNSILVVFTNMSPHDQDYVDLLNEFPGIHLCKPENYIGEDGFGNLENPAFRRYVVIKNWLTQMVDEYSKVIMSDMRDILIQGDPFEQILPTQKGISTFTEVLTYKEEPQYNQRWVRNCYGDEFLATIMDEQITCCGVVAGTPQHMLEYLQMHVAEMQKNYECDGVGLDTAAHVWVTHHLDNVEFVDFHTSLISHALVWGPAWVTAELPTDKDGRLVNDLNKPYALIHQADRNIKAWTWYVEKYNGGTKA